MTDTILVNYRKTVPVPTYRKYTAYILEAVEKRIGKDQFTITDIVVRTTNGTRHRFSVTLKVGIALYFFIHSKGRSDRMHDIMFNLTVETDSQKVTDSLVYDMCEWIGDTLDRNGRLFKSS